MLLLGVGYKMRHGKDQFASFVKDNYKNTHIVHFADELYRQCRNEGNRKNLLEWENVGPAELGGGKLHVYDCEIGGYKTINFPYRSSITQNQFTHKLIEMIISEGKYVKSRNRYVYSRMKGKNRILLQWWGTQFRRMQNEDYWVNEGLKEARRINKKYGDQAIVIFPDTRFPNELDIFDKDVGVTVRVDRNIAPDSASQGAHQSETALEEYEHRFEYIIDNNDTLEEFEKNTIVLIEDLKNINDHYKTIIENNRIDKDKKKAA